MYNLGVGQRVEVAGLKDEGFPSSFSSGVVLGATSKSYRIAFDDVGTGTSLVTLYLYSHPRSSWPQSVSCSL